MLGLKSGDIGISLNGNKQRKTGTKWTEREKKKTDAERENENFDKASFLNK